MGEKSLYQTKIACFAAVFAVVRLCSSALFDRGTRELSAVFERNDHQGACTLLSLILELVVISLDAKVHPPPLPSVVRTYVRPLAEWTWARAASDCSLIAAAGGK